VAARLERTPAAFCRSGSVRFLAAVALCGSLAGCVQRRMMIRSDPPGALVYVDNYEIGTTPVSTNFTYYGTREIRLVKEGYETLTVKEPVPAPWYQVPPLDFVTENLLPGELRDHRTFQYQLAPQMIVPTEELLQRAEDLRGGMQPEGMVLPRDGSWGVPGPGGAGAPLMPVPQGAGGVPIHPLPPGERPPYGRL